MLFRLCEGLGLSLLYLPAVVMVGYYFERRRGIAAGMACSGSGFGLLALAPLAAFLVAEYTWKGALTVLAGISLNCLVWGALMRPLPVPPPVPSPPSSDVDDYDVDTIMPIRVSAWVFTCMTFYLLALLLICTAGSPCSVNHPLYLDDKQLFFYPSCL